jgi:hypothetical protein
MNLICFKVKIPIISIVFGLMTWIICFGLFNDPEIPLGNTFPAITAILSTVCMLFSVIEAKRV